MVDLDKENFCFYPFMQVLLQPTGVVSPCCWNQEIVYGVMPQQSLSEVWNSSVAQQLRKEFIDGNPQSCAQRMRHIGCHKSSLREFSSALELTQIQSSWPKRLDVRLNGRCNLQCIMCDVWKQPNGTFESSDFWRIGPTEIFPHLREMDVLGGEPFVQADTYRLIDEVSAINQKCTWAFVTNGNYRFSETIRSRLDKIKIRWIQMSMDSLDQKVYSEIRLGGDLSKMLATLDQLLRYRIQRVLEGNRFQLIASICVQKLNWKEIPSFLDFCKRRKITPILQFAYEPEKVSLLTLSKKELNEVHLFLSEVAKIYGEELLGPISLPIQEMLI